MIISEMQHKLATWAEDDPNRRFDRLFRLIADETWLGEAARIVLASSGAHTPGIDGIDKQRMQAGLAENLASLRADLLSGNYHPQPVKRIYIPKANGKRRPLGTAVMPMTSLSPSRAPRRRPKPSVKNAGTFWKGD